MANKQLFLNNVETTFLTAIKDTPVTGTPATELGYGILQVNTSTSAAMTNPTGGDYYMMTALKRAGSVESTIEVMKVTAVDTVTFPGECRLTVLRAQEGTTAKAYLAGDYFAMRVTKATLENLQQSGDKDASGGIPGLTLFKINMRNVANTFTSWLTNTNTAARTYTFQDRDGTIADNTDLAAKQSTSGKDATGGYAGLTLFKLNLRNAANTVTSWFTTAATVARTWTMPDKDGTVAMTSDITGTNSGTNTGDQTSIIGITGTIAQFNTAVTDADLATLAGTETLTNKTLTSPTLTTPNLATEVIPVTTNNLPALRPSLLLDFANAQAVDGRITFTRASTATRTNSNGLLETVASGAPRIDYDPVTMACKGLLIEEARTNLLTYSEQFDNAAWTKTRSSIAANAATAPDGTATADKMVEDATASNTHFIAGPAVSIVSGTAYSLSIFIKPAERSWVFITGHSSSFGSGVFAFFNAATGAVGTTAGCTATCTQVGNGWIRASITATATVTGSQAAYQLNLTTGDATYTHTGDGTSGLYIWGAQLEAGAFATSYIPTTSAQVTRASDAATMTGANFSNWYRQDEGTLVATYFLSNVTTNCGIAALSDGTNDNRMIMRATSTAVTASIGVAATATQWNDGFVSGTANTETRFALAYKANDIAMSRNGAATVTDTSATIPTVNRLEIGSDAAAALPLNGHIARLAYYQKRSTNVELQALSA